MLLPQLGSDLGERLQSLPGQAQRLGYGAVAMISSDSPTLPSSTVADCFSQLRSGGVDAVLGPCEDGGYYLIGMKAPQPALFTNIEWSTSRVTEQTLEGARLAGLSVAMMPVWYDADTVDDLERMWADLENNRGTATRTHAVLAGLLPSLLSRTRP